MKNFLVFACRVIMMVVIFGVGALCGGEEYGVQLRRHVLQSWWLIADDRTMGPRALVYVFQKHAPSGAHSKCPSQSNQANWPFSQQQLTFRSEERAPLLSCHVISRSSNPKRSRPLIWIWYNCDRVREYTWCKGKKKKRAYTVVHMRRQNSCVVSWFWRHSYTCNM